MLNAPKYQPCPNCQAPSKRVTKMITTGKPCYHCKKHGGFIVNS
jgi:hypothetical protein